MSKTKFLIAISIALFILFTSHNVFAQTKVELFLVVKDKNGNPLKNALVSVGGIKVRGKTDHLGIVHLGEVEAPRSYGPVWIFGEDKTQYEYRAGHELLNIYVTGLQGEKEIVEIEVEKSKIPEFQPFADIKANGKDGPIEVVVGTNVLITWTSKNVDSCLVLPPGWRGLSGSQTVKFSKPQKISYLLECEGLLKKVADEVVIDVLSQPELDLRINDKKGIVEVRPNTPYIVSWKTKGVDSCFIDRGERKNWANGLSGKKVDRIPFGSMVYTLKCFPYDKEKYYTAKARAVVKAEVIKYPPFIPPPKTSTSGTSSIQTPPPSETPPSETPPSEPYPLEPPQKNIFIRIWENIKAAIFEILRNFIYQ